LNTELYHRLRNKGIKVALIAPYKNEMNDEVTFFFDYFQAGYMTVAKMAVAGFKTVCMARVSLPISYQWMRNGAKQAAEDLGLDFLNDILFDYDTDHTEDIKKLPLKTGIIATQTSVGNGMYDAIIKSGLTLSKDIALCARTDYLKSGYSGVSRLVTPRVELLQAAIDYIFDSDIKSTDIIHRKFKFKYEEHGTIEKV